MLVRTLVFGGFAAAGIGWGLAAGAAALLPWAVLAGLLLWSAIEYLMHRYAFHGFAPHWEHHERPTEVQYILAPLPLSLSMSVALWLLFRAALGSSVLPGMVLAGIWLGYLAYELVHLRIHSAARGGKLLRALRRYHYRHHFADDTVCYGVTSPIWDVVFRTRA